MSNLMAQFNTQFKNTLVKEGEAIVDKHIDELQAKWAERDREYERKYAAEDGV